MQNIKCNACNKDKLQTLINIGKHPISTHLIKTINSSHWLIQDSFDVVSNEILDHINKHNSN